MDISRSYSQARWLYELPGMAADPDSDEWTEGVRTIRIPRKHRGIGTGTNWQGPLHTITSIQVGSATARNGNVVVGKLVTHIDSLPTHTRTLWARVSRKQPLPVTGRLAFFFLIFGEIACGLLEFQSPVTVSERFQCLSPADLRCLEGTSRDRDCLYVPLWVRDAQRVSRILRA